MSRRTEILFEASPLLIETRELAKRMKSAGLSDVQMMEIMALLKDPKMFDAIERRFNDPSYYDNDEFTDEDAYEIFEEVYGKVPSECSGQDRYEALARAAFDKADENPGSVARLANTIAYCNDSRQWIGKYDAKWKKELNKADIVELINAMVEMDPNLEYLRTEQFQSRPTMERVMALATIVDEFHLADERNEIPPLSMDVDVERAYERFGRLYGVGKARVKSLQSIYSPKEKDLPERVELVSRLNNSDYLLVRDMDDVRKAYDMGIRRFACMENVLAGSVIGRARCWWTGIYTDDHVFLPPLPQVDTSATADWMIKGLQYNEDAKKKKMELEESKPVAEVVVAAPVVEVSISTEVSPFVLKAYDVLKTGPGKAYYLGKKHIKKTFAFSKINIRKQPVTSPVASVDLVDKIPVEELYKQPPKVVLDDNNQLFERYKSVFYDRMTYPKLREESWMTKEELYLFESKRGKGPGSLSVALRKGIGAEATMLEAFEATLRIVDSRFGRVPDGVVLACAVLAYSNYAILSSGDLSRN